MVADEDVKVTSDDEEDGAADVGGDAQVAGLPPYVDAIIQGYSQQFGRVLGRKLVRAKDPTKDRDRLVVTYENGQSQRKAVTFRIGKEGRAADPSDKTDTGSPAETTIVESVEDVKAPTKPAAQTREVRRPDGQNHIMERDPTTGEYSIDRGLAPNQPTPVKPKPTDPTGWKPVKTPDGRVVGMLDPATGDVQTVTQRDAKTVETKDGRIITIDADGKTAKDITPESPGDKMIPANAPKFTPDYLQPDGGLTAYNESLLEARRNGTINREQGLRLLNQAGAIWEQTRGHGKELADEASTAYGQDITQRGQDIGEVQSRRQDAGTIYGDAFRDYSSFGGKLPTGSGGVAADAFQAALNIGRRNAGEWGGLTDVPHAEVPEAIQAIRKVKIGKDGSVHIEIPDPTPNTPVTAADQQAQQAAASQNAAQGAGLPSGGATGAPASTPAAGAQSPNDPLFLGSGGEVYTRDGKISMQGANGQPRLIGTWDPSQGQPQGTSPMPNVQGSTPLSAGELNAIEADNVANPRENRAGSQPQAGATAAPAPTGIPDGGNVQMAPGEIAPVMESARTAVPEWQPHPNTIAELKKDGYTDEEIASVMARMTA